MTSGRGRALVVVSVHLMNATSAPLRRPLAGLIALALSTSLLVAGSGAGVATPRKQGRLPKLKGTNIITAERSAVMEVLLPGPVLFREGESITSPNAEVDSLGRITGFVLVQAEARQRYGNVIVWALRFGACSERACRPASPVGAHQMASVTNATFIKEDKAWLIPAGRYYLYVVTDGAPLKARLSFDELLGQVRLTPTEPIVPELVNLEPDTGDVAGLKPLYSASDEHENSSDIVFQADQLIFDISPHYNSYTGTCFYADGNRPMGGIHKPYCPDADAASPVIYLETPSTRLQSMMYGHTDLVAKPPGSWYAGVYHHGTQGRAEFETSILWLDLLDAAVVGERRSAPTTAAPGILGDVSCVARPALDGARCEQRWTTRAAGSPLGRGPGVLQPLAAAR